MTNAQRKLLKESDVGDAVVRLRGPRRRPRIPMMIEESGEEAEAQVEIERKSLIAIDATAKRTSESEGKDGRRRSVCRCRLSISGLNFR